MIDIEIDEGFELLSTEEAIEAILEAVHYANEELNDFYRKGELEIKDYKIILGEVSHQAAEYIQILKRQG